MPPKKETKSLGKPNAATVEPTKKVIQQKLFSKQVVEEPKKVQKTKSKQFSEGKDLNTENSVKRWEYGSGKTPSKLLIASWNVNGIRSVLSKGDLMKYLESTKPDILCLNETKIDQKAFNQKHISIPGYHGYWNFCKTSAGYSGVAIFSKHLPLAITQDLSQPIHSQEGRVITMEFQKFFLITAYIPNAGQKLDRLSYRVNQYDQCFQDHCEKLRKEKTVILCGDLNVVHQQIDIARPKGNQRTAGFTKEERESFSKFLAKGWIDSYRKLYPKEVKYSWWSMRTKGREKNIGWRLDYFIVNEEGWKYVKDSQINNDVYGSDHCPIELKIEF